MDMRRVYRNRSDELESALIQTIGHGVQILTRGLPVLGDNPPGTRRSNWMASLSVRTGSDPMHCG